MTTFDVDFNNMAHGQVITNRNRADGPFEVGDEVLVIDSAEEDMHFTGTVARIDAVGHVYLDFDRTSQP